MADELDISKLSGWVLVGAPDEIEVPKLSGWVLVGPHACPPPGPFTDAHVGDVIKYKCNRVQLTLIIDDFNAEGEVLGEWTDVIVDGPETARTIRAGGWSFATPVTEVSGLDHLEGMAVMALADGLVVHDLTVTDGAVTLPRAAAFVTVGLQYTGQVQTLYLDIQTGLGTVQGARKLEPAVTLRVDGTRGLQIGQSWTDMVDLINQLADPAIQPPHPMTGDIRNLIPGQWEEKGEVMIRQVLPLPATILGVIAEVVEGDTAH